MQGIVRERIINVVIFLLASLYASELQHGMCATVGHVQVSAKTRFYDVTGTNGPAIRRQIALLGPVTPEGKRFDAYTDWKRKWVYAYNSVSNRFAVSSATVSLDIVFTLPRWMAPKGTSQAALNEWNEYITALIKHEQGHSNITWHCADKLLNNLNQKSIFHSSKKLDRFVGSEGEKCLAEAKEKNLDYDKQTHNGATQGARLRLK